MTGFSTTGTGLAPTTASAAPTATERPDEQYPALINSHVVMLRALGTPETMIAQINAGKPDPNYMSRYIQGSILQNLEGWDAVVGNPTGTARAGLLQLAPGAVVPAPGQGHPGYMDDGTPVEQSMTPGITPGITPDAAYPGAVAPQTAPGNGLVKAVLGTVAAGAAGLIGWKLFKNRSAPQQVMTGVANVAGGGGAGGIGAHNPLAQLGSHYLVGGMQATDPHLINRGLVMSALGEGRGLSGLYSAATTDAVSKGIGPADGFLHSVGIASLAHNLDFTEAAHLSIANRLVGTLETAAKRGPAQLASTQAAVHEMLTPGGAAGVTPLANAGNAGLRDVLASVANAMPH